MDPLGESTSDCADTGASSADEIADALLSAPAAARTGPWSRSQGVPAAELAWALKRACDAAWTTDPPKTRLAAELIAELAARRPDAEVDALAAWTRGIGLLSHGEMEPALQALDLAGERFASLGRRHERAQTQVARLMALSMLGRFDEAIECGTTARAAFDALGDALAAGKVELNLGNLAARRDRRDAAARHFGEARQRFAAAGNAELEIMAMYGLAQLLAQQHAFEQATALYAQARCRAAGGGFGLLVASIDGDLGALEMLRGRYDVALRHLERSCSGYAALDAPHYLAVAEETLADAYLELNLLPEALALYQRALTTYEAAGLVTDRAWALLQRGRASSLSGRHDDAAAALLAAAQAFEQQGHATAAALAQLGLAELALRQRRWDDARRRAEAAAAPLLAARQLSWHLHARCVLAEALSGAGDAREAEQVAAAAADVADRMTLPPAQRRARLLLGLLARARGDAAAARHCFEAVVESIESQRGTLPSEEFRAAFLGDNLRPYHELVRGCIEAGGAQAAEAALHWIERARARSLADSVEARPAADDPGADAAHGVGRLRRQLDDCYRRLARPPDGDAGDDPGRLLDEVQRIEAALLEAGRRRAAAAGRGARAVDGAVDLPALHAALADHSALVEYFSIDEALYACVVGGGRVVIVPLPARLTEVQALIEQLRFQTDTLRHGAARLAHRLPELQQRALLHLRRLHAALWAPLAAAVGDRRTVVVPHGVLHYLPFEALHDGVRFEVERRALCRAPSAAVLLRCLSRPTGRLDSALLLGHADQRLPQIGAELRAVAAEVPHVRLLLDDAARADVLRGGAEADVLHIACHAQFRHDSPRFSALHLADGALTVRDAAALRLRCGLVTLSACETGISAVMPGDELIGLTHAFIAAGAARVLASLWTVQDDSAPAFMQRFYRRLREHEPARALRETQLETLGTHPHPYFWAAFTLHGGW